MRVWVRGGMVAGWVLPAVFGGAAARAQVATTTVQDTVTDASGAGASGSVIVSWAAFTTAGGSSVAAGSLTTTLGAGGALSVALQPNAGATPMGSYYTAVFHLSDGTTSREFWVVPVLGTGTVKLGAIRNQVLPLSVAMQTVSRQYVDTTVAKAMAGVGPGGSVPYLLKSGDTMQGPLTLSADPAAAMQAASKHYVDAAVAGVSAGAAGAAGGDLSGTYPHPTVAAVHATAGSLDGVAVGQTTPAAGSFSSLSTNGAFNALSTGYVFQMYASTLSVGSNLNQFTVDQGGNVTSAGSVSAVAYHETLTTPANSSANCSAGDFTDDANFHYVCTAASTWKRVALSSF